MPRVGSLYSPESYGYTKVGLAQRGWDRVVVFCKLNNLEVPKLTVVPKRDWVVSACAYYRPDTELMREWTNPGINICLEECAFVAGENPSRNWNWPGSVTDREPYGVIAHELGHHADWSAGERKGKYYSEYCEDVMAIAKEKPITSYTPNPAEWFAEMFRLFVTNPPLLSALRPRTYAALILRWKPLDVGASWESILGKDVPARILNNLRKKVGSR